MASLDNLPPALDRLRVYLQRASELQRASPVAAHAVRTFAMQLGMSMKDRLRPTDLQFLVVLMDELERERQQLTVSRPKEDHETATRKLGLDLYNRAKAADKPEFSNPQVQPRACAPPPSSALPLA